MEVVRQFIDAGRLMSVMPLPKSMLGKRLEIIIIPTDESEDISKSDDRIDSIVDSLIGIIPDNGMSLEDYRAERLRKYEAAD